MKPLVSIIIPTYNRSHLIGETLDSVIAQTYKNWECIVVDDGSADYTDELLEFYCEKDPRIQFHHRPENRLKGANACRNEGLISSQGQYVMFLDSDDLLAEYCLRNRVDHALKFPEVEFFVFRMKTFNKSLYDSSALINNYPILEQDDYLKMFLRHHLPWQTTCLFIDSASLKVRFNESLQRFQDVLFSIQLILSSNSFKVFQNVAVDCFYRYDSINKLKYRNKNFKLIILKSFLILIENLTKEVKELPDLKTQLNYKKEIIKSYNKYFRTFVLTDFENLRGINNQIYIHLELNGYFGFKEKVRWKVINLLLNNFSEIKGVGVYRLINVLLRKA